MLFTALSLMLRTRCCSAAMIATASTVPTAWNARAMLDDELDDELEPVDEVGDDDAYDEGDAEGELERDDEVAIDGAAADTLKELDKGDDELDDMVWCYENLRLERCR